MRREGLHVGQHGRPHVGAHLKDTPQLLGRQLQQDLEGLGLGALLGMGKHQTDDKKPIRQWIQGHKDHEGIWNFDGILD